MNLFGFGKPKVVPFNQFRDYVRSVVRRNEPNAKMDNTENGFILTHKGTPIACNLRNLYAAYSKDARERDVLIKNWLDTLIMEVPDQTWSEAQQNLRPMLKTVDYIKRANHQLQRSPQADVLAARPFVGDLGVIAVREYGGTLTAVTQSQLERWGVSIDEVIRQGMNNMSMMGFPVAVNELRSTGSLQRGAASSGDVVGLVFEDNHLTATWLVLERFRDHIAMRLHHDFVVSVPYRSRLVVVRADEPALVANVIASARSGKNVPYALTTQCFHVDAGTTGGTVTVYTGTAKGQGMDSMNLFGAGSMADSVPNMAVSNVLPPVRANNAPIDFSQWGVNEPTDDNGDSGMTPWNMGNG